MHATEFEDALAALEFAARYHFRPGVSKTIILVPCAACSEVTLSYADVLSLLSDRNISLSMIIQNDFSVNKDNPTTSYIFGVDSETVYSRKDFGDLAPTGDQALRPQVAVPKDLCTALTDHTDGALFNARHLVSGRPQGEKKFMDVMSAVIAARARPAECQQCECVPPE